MLHATALEAERLGLFEGRSADKCVWDWRMGALDALPAPLASGEKTDSMAGLSRHFTLAVLARRLPDELVIADASMFAPSYDYLQFPGDGLVVWKELKKLVIAVVHKRHVAYAQPLTDGELTPTVIHEMRCFHFQAEASGLPEAQANLTLAGNFPDENLLQLQQQLGLQATRAARPVPRVPGKALALTPTEVIAARERRRRNRLRPRVAASVALLYVVVMGVWLNLPPHRPSFTKQ
jgi:hypothetical protein